MHCGRVLVVDDLPDVRTTLTGLLSDMGHEVRSASSRDEALQLMDAERFHVAVLDVRLDESDEDNQDGLLLMEDLHRKWPSTAVIILTGYGTVAMVQKALQPNRDETSMAFGFLQKSEFDRLPEYVQLALEQVLRQQNAVIGNLVAQGENQQIEFKAAMRWDYKTRTVNRSIGEAIAAAIAGMLNSTGGTLLIGIADDGTVVGIEHDLQTLRKASPDSFQLAFTDIVKTYLGMESLPYLNVRFEQIGGKQICVVGIEKSPEPVYLVGGDTHKFFVRVGNSTRSLDVKETVHYTRKNWPSAS
jgi:CheY-like chemotaxis protein